MIDYEQLTNSITKELNFEAVQQKLELPIDIGTEQYFNARYSDPTANVDEVIYGCLQFGSTTPNGHVYQIGVAGTFISTPGTAETVKNLLTAFAERQTPQKSMDGAITLQVWSTPYVTQNFVPVGNSYRSLIRIQGTLILTQGIDETFEVSYTWKNPETQVEREVPIFGLSFSLGIASTTDSQIYYSRPISQSWVKATSRTFSISTYLLSADMFIKDVFDAALKPDGAGLRKTFRFHIVTDQFDTYLDCVLVSVALGKTIGNLASVQLDFVEGGELNG